LRQHDYAQFTAHFVQGSPEPLEGNGDWRVLRRGSCDGILIGGYTQNFAWLPGGDYFRYDAQQKYLLFLEDHERFRAPVAVSAYLSHIEQSPFINRVSGLIFGHYAQDVPDDLLHRLERFGAKHGVPVVYCDDFGHGNRHAILPIGVHAALDTDTQRLRFHA
jgi:muramoyltetrapeptide carboxypeptidase